MKSKTVDIVLLLGVLLGLVPFLMDGGSVLPSFDPPPIDEAGLRVAIIEETADRSSLPKSQMAILTSVKLREYLDANCVKEDGQPAYRIWDKDIDASRESQLWQDALAKVKATEDLKTPAILISNGKTGYIGPLDGTVEETIDRIKQYEVE